MFLTEALPFPQHAANRFYSGLISRWHATQSSVGTGQFPSFLPMDAGRGHPTGLFPPLGGPEINAWHGLGHLCSGQCLQTAGITAAGKCIVRLYISILMTFAVLGMCHILLKHYHWKVLSFVSRSLVRSLLQKRGWAVYMP